MSFAEFGQPHGYEAETGKALWCCLCISDKGKIPGCTDGVTSWFPWGGRAHYTNDFIVHKSRFVSRKLVGEHHSQQNDGHRTYCAIAITEFGLLPGKADKKTCWYSHNDHECLTGDFMYINDGETFDLSDSCSINSPED